MAESGEKYALIQLLFANKFRDAPSGSLKIVLVRLDQSAYRAYLKHGVGDSCGARSQDAESHSGKAVSVVALVRTHQCPIGQRDTFERTSTCKYGFAIGPESSFLCTALAVTSGVGQGKYDGLVNVLGHLANGSFGKHIGGTTKSKHHGRFDIFDYFFKFHAVSKIFASESRSPGIPAHQVRL
jgi:hypothetical protein